MPRFCCILVQKRGSMHAQPASGAVREVTMTRSEPNQAIRSQALELSSELIPAGLVSTVVLIIGAVTGPA